MNRTVLLISGVLLAGLFLFAEYTWRQQVLEQADPGIERRVFAAVRTLDRGTRIEQDMLQIVSATAREMGRSPDAIPEEQLSEALGRPLRRPLAPGEFVRRSDFDSASEVRLAGVVPALRRAVSVQVDALNSFGGLLRPDDRVDILASVEHPQKNRRVTLPFLHGVRVLAVGSDIVGGTTSRQGPRSTVTLDLDYESALRVKHLEETGELVFLLRNSSDETPSPHFEEIDLSAILKPIVVAPRSKPTDIDVHSR